MEINTQNMDLLEKKQKNIYQWLQDHNLDEIENEIEEIQLFNCKDGNQGIIIKKEEKEYRLNSLYRPIEEAKKWAEQYNYNNLSIVALMFGLGNGIFAKELLKRLRKDALLCIYEPSVKVFHYALMHFDLTDLLSSNQVVFIIEPINQSMLPNFLSRFLHWSNIKSEIVCEHPQYEKIFINSCHYFLSTIADGNDKTLINRNTEGYFGKTIVENTIKNLKFINQSNILLEFYDDIPKEIPAIIVSAGPSLDKNIQELKKAKGKAVIFATDTAVRYLFQYNIEPDFIVTIDPKKPPEYLSDPRCKDIPMFCKVEANFKILNFHQGRKIWFSCGVYLTKIYEKYGKTISNYQSGGSVATGAFSVCAGLGFKHIILIGQDLAYSGEITHAGGDINHILYEEDGIRMVEDIDGNPIKTRHDWYIYLKWFERAIEEIPDQEVIDATEGGAKIHGAKIMALEEVIKEYCVQEIDCKEIVSKKHVTLNEEQLKGIKQYILDSIKELEQIEKMAKQTIEVCERVIRLVDKNPYANLDNFAKKIVKANETISNQNVYDLVDIYISEVSSKQLGSVYQVSDDKKRDILDTYSNTKVVYEAVCKAVKEISQIFNGEIENF